MASKLSSTENPSILEDDSEKYKKLRGVMSSSANDGSIREGMLTIKAFCGRCKVTLRSNYLSDRWRMSQNTYSQ
jgi:hypothetical protein